MNDIIKPHHLFPRTRPNKSKTTRPEMYHHSNPSIRTNNYQFTDTDRLVSVEQISMNFGRTNGRRKAYGVCGFRRPRIIAFYS